MITITVVVMLKSEAFDDEAFVDEGVCGVCEDVTVVKTAGQFCIPALSTSVNSMHTIIFSIQIIAVYN